MNIDELKEIGVLTERSRISQELGELMEVDEKGFVDFEQSPRNAAIRDALLIVHG